MPALRTVVVALFAAAVALAGAPGALAAPTGLAWDAVSKIAMNADAATLSPGDFDQDFAQASNVEPPPDSSSGGFMAKMGQAMAMGRHMQALMQNGFAEKHYVAGSKERTDQVAEQTATIVDCAARTITKLDLRRKTYTVTSMDQSSAAGSSGGSSAPEPRASDDGTRLAITIANTTLGSRDVSGLPANGYRSEITFTETKPSGESHTQNGNLVGYYSNYANPVPSCGSFGEPAGAQGANGRFSAMTAGFSRLMRAMSAVGNDSRFSLKQSGPPLPRSKMALYEAATFGAGDRGAAGTFLTERGHVRAISENDPAFTIPSDFTRGQ